VSTTRPMSFYLPNPPRLRAVLFWALSRGHPFAVLECDLNLRLSHQEGYLLSPT
jgi:hypothetical protein